MLSMLRTDAGLVKQVLAGHSRSFDELVRRHLPMAYGIAFSHTRNHADAEDLSQEALLKAFMSLDSLREPKKFAHWLSVITRNLALRYTRNRRNEKAAIEENAAQPRDRNTPAYDDMRELLEEHIAELDPVPREVLMLHYFSGKTTREIAATMNVSQAAVLKRLQRAREALGAKLITELNITPHTKDDITKHRATIMKTIFATGFSWNLAGTTLKTTAAATLFSGKGIAAIVLLTAIIASWLAIPTQTPPPQERTLSIASNLPNVEEAPAQATITTLATEPTIIPPKPLTEAAPAVLTTEPKPEIDPEPESPLTGNWTMYTYQEGMSYADNQGQVNFLEKDAKVKVTGAPAYYRLDGALVGDDLYLDFFEDNEEDPIYRGRLLGRVSESHDVINLAGMTTWTYRTRDGYEDQSFVFHIDFKKTGDAENQRNEELERAKSRLDTLQRALKTFLEKEGHPANSLKELYPDYLDDKSLINSTTNERIVYTQVWDEFQESQKKSIDTARYYSPMYGKGADAQILLDWEQELEEAWGNHFPSGFTFLRLENADFDFRLATGIWSSTHEVNRSASSTYQYNTIGEYENKDQEGAARETCVMNLKQLGLSIRMFENEDPNELIPPGFRQIFPEYMPDLSTLTCPTQPAGTMSYEIVFPASNHEFRKQIYSQVHGIRTEEAIDHLVNSQTPMIIERHECSESGGRNVIFADGHAEWIPDKDWGTIIAPYLQYNY